MNIPGISEIRKKFNALSRNHEQLYILFVTILMLVNTILLFTEKMSPEAMGAFILIPLALQMLLMAAVKRPGIMFLFLIPKIILDAFQLVLLKLYGGSVIAVDMWLNLVTTNATEAGELLTNLIPTIIFLLLLYIPSIVLAIKSLQNKGRINPQFRRTVFRYGINTALLGAIFFAVAKLTTPGFEAKYNIYPGNVIYNMEYAIRKWYKSNNYPNTSKNFTFNARKDDTLSDSKREIYVLVLGETARAANWSLYGYERKTTPRVDTLKGIIKFSDALTQSNTTHKSIPLTLTPADADSYEMIYRCKSIVTLFKEAGFKTVYLTNHEYRQTFMDYYFREADVAISVKDQSHNSYDQLMLKPLRKEISKDSSDLFIIVHLYGSHFNYYQRYPDSFAIFKPDVALTISKKYKEELINSYDNSIIATDYMIERIVSIIRHENAASALLYASDHGEDLLDDKRNRFLHASPVPTFYQLNIPFIAWFSEEYKELYPEKSAILISNSSSPVSTTASIFHTLADLASIRSEYVRYNLSLCSDKFQVVPRKYVTDHDKGIRIDELDLSRFDYQQFIERGIKLD